MSVIKRGVTPTREMAHFKKNLVLELFGNSKRHISNKENIQNQQKPLKRYLSKNEIGNPGSILSLLKRSENPIRPRGSNRKNEPSIDKDKQSRKVQNAIYF